MSNNHVHSAFSGVLDRIAGENHAETTDDLTIPLAAECAALNAAYGDLRLTLVDVRKRLEKALHYIPIGSKTEEIIEELVEDLLEAEGK